MYSNSRVNVLKFTLILFLGKYLSAVKYLDFAPHFREFRQNMEKICFKYIEGFFCFNSLVKIILCICCKFGFPRFFIFHSDKWLCQSRYKNCKENLFHHRRRFIHVMIYIGWRADDKLFKRHFVSQESIYAFLAEPLNWQQCL